MPKKTIEVKKDDENNRLIIVIWYERCRSWILRHPAFVWFLFLLMVANYFIDLLQAIGVL